MPPYDNDRVAVELTNPGWSQPEIHVPAGGGDGEPVQRIRVPAALRYRYNPGTAATEFLLALADKKLVGGVCPETGDVYVPPRGMSPAVGRPTVGTVEIGPNGTVTTFCVVHIGFGVNAPPTPFVSALILPDGASVSLYGTILEIPIEQVRTGMRLEPVWVDDDELTTSFENIKYWRPLDEPDVDPEQLKGHM